MPQYDQKTGESSGSNSPVLYELLRRGRSFSGHERHCLYLNTGQTQFANISAASGFDFPDDGRCLSLVDWDQDGDLDMWIINRNAPQVRFLRNDLPRNDHFVSIGLQGTTCNRDAIGARVEVVIKGKEQGITLLRTLRAGDGYMAQSSKWLHFGLGKAEQIEKLVVRWPGNEYEQFTNSGSPGMPVDNRYLLVQGTGETAVQAVPDRTVNLQPSQLRLPAQTETAQTLLVYAAPLPELRYQSWEQRELSVDHELEQPLLLNLWASWCTPCLKELNEISERQNELRHAGVDVLALSVDGLGVNKSEVGAAQRLLDQMKFPFPSGRATEQLVDLLQMVNDILFDYHGELPVPTSFLIDRQRALAAIYKGPVEVDRVLIDLEKIKLKGDALRMAAQPFTGRWFGKQPGHRFLRLATNLFMAGEYENAGQYLLRNQGYFGDHPVYIDLLTKTGIGLASKRHNELAAKIFGHLETLTPASPSVHFYLAQALQNSGRPEQAIVEYRRVLQLDPNSVTGNFHLGLMLAGRGDVEQALPYFRKTTEVKPDWAAGQFNLAMALAEVDQAEQAVVHLQETLRLRPVDLTTQIRLTWTLAAHPDPRFRNAEQAVYWGQHICEATKNKLPGALDALAAAYAEQGDFDRAVTTLHQAVERVLAVKQDANTQEMEHRLQLYQNGEPYRTSR